MFASLRMLPLDAHQAAQEVLAAAQTSSHPYEILLLPRTATFQEARSAYKRLLFLHPDKNPGNDLASEAFKCVNQAFELIKTSQEQTLQTAQPQQVSRKWSAFTGDAVSGPIAAPAQAKQPAEAHLPQQSANQQQPPGAASKWGRPSVDAMRMLKVPEPTATRSNPPSKPHTSKNKKTTTRNRMQSKSSTRTVAPEAKARGDEHGISGQEFYGTRNTKRHRPLEDLNVDTAGASTDAKQTSKEPSQWASKKTTSLSDVLRGSMPVASNVAVQNKRVNRAIDSSDDDEVSWEDSSSSSDAESEVEIVEGEEETEAAAVSGEAPQQDASPDEGSDPDKTNWRSERSRNLFQSLVAEEAAAKMTASLGAAAAASKQRRVAAMQRLFQRRRPKTGTGVS